MKYLSKKIGENYILWLEESNRYLFLKEPAFRSLILYNGNIAIPDIVSWFSKKYGLPPDISKEVIDELIEKVNDCSQTKTIQSQPLISGFNEDPVPLFSVRYYTINTVSFCFCFQSNQLETLFNDFFRIYTSRPSDGSTRFYFMTHEQILVIKKENEILGAWKKEQFPEAKAKLFAEILCLIYAKKEEDWAAIFHAASLKKNGKAILFPGVSGSGKSILSLILQSKGWEILSDDYSPLDTYGMHLYKYPAPVGIQRKFEKLMADYLPVGLYRATDTTESEKIRIIPKQFSMFVNAGYPVQAIVFIRYQPDVLFQCQRIPNDRALEKLIPDSWISKHKENVVRFLDWIGQIPCFDMVYSDTDRMCDWAERILTGEQI